MIHSQVSRIYEVIEEIICSRKYNGAVVPLATISELQHFTLLVLICVCVFVSLDGSHATDFFVPFFCRLQSNDRNGNTDAEYVHSVFDLCDGNARAALMKYQRQYPHPRQLADVFTTVHRSQGENTSELVSQARIEQVGMDVLDAVHAGPSSRICQVSYETGRYQESGALHQIIPLLNHTWVETCMVICTRSMRVLN
jgi:hypothetical protein